MVELEDEFGRKFKTLRVSLINTCNLGCVYCTCGSEDLKENKAFAKKRSLDSEELTAIIAQLHAALQLETIRFTGGEPLLYKDLPAIVHSVKQLGISELKLTTNGILLESQAQDLAKAGISSINVSLDAIDEDAFFRISRRRGIERILRGIDKAVACGINVKINSVVMKGVNEDQVLPLLDYAFSRNLNIRFLEIMAMGHLFEKADEHFFAQENILSLIGSKYQYQRLNRTASSTANYWKTTGGHIFGIVANETEPFCGDCNRLRLDSFGNIYGCLSSNSPISARNISSNGELVDKLQMAMQQKQISKFTGSSLSMLNIGG